ncbi:MAG: hypothetical protein WAV00_17970 [Nocardioides sp.]
MSLLSEDGLDATYLAANLRQPPPPPGPRYPRRHRPSTEARLTDLPGLLDKGVITQQEYDARRQGIIDSA